MSAPDNGFIGHLQRKYPHVVYQRCASHKLNLVIQYSCQMDSINIFMQNLNHFAAIIRKSSKRMAKWREIVSLLHQNYPKEIEKCRAPTQIGLTRWSSKFRAINGAVRSVASYIAIVKSTYNINFSEFKPKSEIFLSQLKILLQFWLNYKNIVIAHIMNEILSVCQKTTIFLQKNGLVVIEMLKQISNLYQQLTSFSDPEKLLNLINAGFNFADEVINRICCDEELHFEEEPLIDTSCSDSIRKCILDFIAELQKNLQHYFIADIKDNLSFYENIQTLEPSLFPTQLENKDQISMLELCRYARIDHDLTVDELKNVMIAFMSSHSITDLSNPEILNSFFKFICQSDVQNTFPNIFHLYKYVYSLPCTEVKCENDFSHLRLTKTYTRSKMSDEFLADEMLILLNKDIVTGLDVNDIVDQIAISSQKMKTMLMAI